jgi:hypothetical protein
MQAADPARIAGAGRWLARCVEVAAFAVAGGVTAAGLLLLAYGFTIEITGR